MSTKLGAVKAAVLLAVWLGAGLPLLAQTSATKDKVNARPTFAAADAARVLEDLRQALESGSRGRFLKAFDGRRMPGYAAFRDQLEEFFGKYDSLRMHYRVTQTRMGGEFGAVVAEVGIDGVPVDGAGPGVRRDASVRLVTDWDGKSWKITDLAPRSLFR